VPKDNKNGGEFAPTTRTKHSRGGNARKRFLAQVAQARTKKNKKKTHWRQPKTIGAGPHRVTSNFHNPAHARLYLLAKGLPERPPPTKSEFGLARRDVHFLILSGWWARKKAHFPSRFFIAGEGSRHDCAHIVGRAAHGPPPDCLHSQLRWHRGSGSTLLVWL